MANSDVLELGRPTQLSMQSKDATEIEMLSEGLRLIRVFHDMSQRELAAKLGIAQSYLSEIEKGKKVPTVGILEAYSKVFSMPLSSIMFFSEEIDRTKRADRARSFISKKIIRLLDFIDQRGVDFDTDDD